MTVVARSLDDLDRLAFRLSRTVRTQFPQLLSQGFTLTDLEERLLPYRDVRREMADSGPDAFETTLLRLVSGERGYVLTDPGLQQASLQALAFPSPTLALVREWATTSLRLGDVSGAASGTTASGRPTQALELFPAPSDQSASRAGDAKGDAKRDASGGLANVRRVTPARGSRAVHAHCRYCDSQLPGDRKITYCPHCGMDLTKRQCQACSTELEAHWRYCVTCGRGS